MIDAKRKKGGAGVIEIIVYGDPGPQGSKRHVGRGIMVESSKKVKPWREAVKYAAIECEAAGKRLDGPLGVSLIFTLKRPVSAPKRRWAPDTKPDLDKLVRSTLDALTQAGVIVDDARIVYLVAGKVWPGDDCSLHSPGAIIEIFEGNPGAVGRGLR